MHYHLRSHLYAGKLSLAGSPLIWRELTGMRTVLDHRVLRPGIQGSASLGRKLSGHDVLGLHLLCVHHNYNSWVRSFLLFENTMLVLMRRRNFFLPPQFWRRRPENQSRQSIRCSPDLFCRRLDPHPDQRLLVYPQSGGTSSCCGYLKKELMY
jgi:hypothetical protein